jgi:hypothetical protein
MNRALRRHYDKVAKVHRIRVVLTGKSAWWKCFWMWNGELLPLYDEPRKLWRPANKLLMLTPMSHHRETMHRPARIKARRNAHLVVRGVDPDTLQWLDGKKPYVYYW